MSRGRWTLAGILALVALAAGGFMAARLQAPAPPEAARTLAVAPDCDPAAGGCAAGGEDLRLQVRFDRTVTPLEPFTVRLEADSPLDDARLRFDMAGMDMGLNAYRMRPAGGRWEATVMLPVCATGRRDWIVTVTVVRGGTAFRAVIPFVVR